MEAVTDCKGRLPATPLELQGPAQYVPRREEVSLPHGLRVPSEAVLPEEFVSHDSTSIFSHWAFVMDGMQCSALNWLTWRIVVAE